VKNAKAYSLRTAQAVARYGKAAQHPVCQAGLQLWRVDAELLKLAKGICSLSEVLSSARKQKKQAQALLDCLYEQGKQKEVIEAADLVRKINDLLKKTQTNYETMVKGFKLCLDKIRPRVLAQFGCEYDAVVRAKDTKALRALKRVHKKWSVNPNADGVRLKDGARRELEILKMLQDKAFRATWAKTFSGTNGAAAGYWEAATGGERPLSDEFWQGRFTVMEFRSGLETMYGPSAAGDKEGKEVRRALKGLGIQPAKDQVGRKWKPPCPAEQKTKRPVERPRKVKLTCVDTIDSVRSYKARKKDWCWRPTTEFANKQAAIDRELSRLGRIQRKSLQKL
jgi:hypothetical protein